MPDFQARCEQCRKVATFTEGTKERRKADFTVEKTWFFRCGNCSATIDRLLDITGVLHKWNGNRHTTYRPGT